MPHLAIEPSTPGPGATEYPGQSLAILAESLYLANLLLAPGLAFVALAWLAYSRYAEAPELARCHFRQTLAASLWAGVLLIIVTLGMLFWAAWTGSWAWTWVLLVTYFTCCHSMLILLGIVGLSKALAGQCWRFPVVGQA